MTTNEDLGLVIWTRVGTLQPRDFFVELVLCLSVSEILPSTLLMTSCCDETSPDTFSTER